MAEQIAIGGHGDRFASTARTDRWWVGPMLTVLGLGGFCVYATWAAFQGEHYYVAPYLSPFYSPLLFVKPGVVGGAPISDAWLGAWPTWWPAFLPASPAFLILAFRLVPGHLLLLPQGLLPFFFRDATGLRRHRVPRKRYEGETALLLFQNLHRYALYFAIVFIFILYYDGFSAFFREGRFGVGVGSIVLLINPTLLAAYTFGCHSFRHLIGGRLDCFSCDAAAGARHGFWKRVSSLNALHMEFAWMSLFWVGFSDLYVRLVSMGILHDFSTWG